VLVVPVIVARGEASGVFTDPSIVVVPVFLPLEAV
jgi:hypothetical protein